MLLPAEDELPCCLRRAVADETNVDTSLLKTFLEVAKTRHFSRAADALFLTQSAVSARIKQLDAEHPDPEGLLAAAEAAALALARAELGADLEGRVDREDLLAHLENVRRRWRRRDRRDQEGLAEQRGAA